jgi:hypothetical protein
MGKMRDDFEQLVIFVGAKLAKWSGLASDESAKRRYLGGMKPDKYYDEVVYPDLKETFEILGFKYDKGKEARTSRVAFHSEKLPDASRRRSSSRSSTSTTTTAARSASRSSTPGSSTR